MIPQNRVFRRQVSKDDSHVKNNLQNQKAAQEDDLIKDSREEMRKENSVSTSSCSSSSFSSSSSVCDLHVNNRSSRVDRFQHQFVQIHLDELEFPRESEEEETNSVSEVIIAMFLQAKSRLYEVIVIDKEKQEEISRLYVYEDELEDQMHKRYAKLRRFHHHDEKRSSVANRSQMPIIPNFPEVTPKKESSKDPTERYNLSLGVSKFMSNISHAKLKKGVIMERRDVSEDICMVYQKDISYFIAVIVQSLYISRMKDFPGRVNFMMFDECSRKVFNTFTSIPPDEKNTVATFADVPAIVKAVKSKAILFSDHSNEANETRELISTASQLSTECNASLLKADLHRKSGRYQYEDTLNPNRKRYRLLWQAAYAAVLSKIREQRDLRAEWSKVLSMAKDSKEREEMMRIHAKEGKFRKLALGNEQPEELNMNDIANYREALKKKRRKAKQSISSS